MTQTFKLAALGALAATALFSFTATAGAKPQQLDNYCSPSGDICQEITLSKHGGRIKFGLYSFTAAVTGEYTVCVKGVGTKECHDFMLEQAPDEEVWSDRVSWENNFPATNEGLHIVKWKYMGERIGKKLKFDIGQISPEG
jgi:hypothetical protein